MNITNLAGFSQLQSTEWTSTQQENEISRFREIFDQAMRNELQDRAQIREAAEMFEAYFLQIMFREMRRSTFSEQGLFPRSQTEQIFTDMLDEQVATDASRSPNGLGLADMIYAQMTRHFR